MIMEDRPEKQRAKRSQREKGRSCTGYLFYNSTLKSNAQNPACIGLSRAPRPVPEAFVGQTETTYTENGRTFAKFYYDCVGYSVYFTEKDSSAMKQDAQGHLPACIGLQRVLGNRQASPGNTSSAPSHLHNRDEARELPPRQTHRPKPAAATEDGFLTRFTRNANVVASGVVKNMKRVGRYVKETVDDALTSDRKRHK